jgi:TetR/AcrR family transcriptional regulator, transcriptional repressor for nem operon
MRYGKDQKQVTRRRILEAAGRRFKHDGIDGAGLATVMADAGLTNGAFYAHFASKEDLVANVLADQLRAQRQSFAAHPSDRAGLEAMIRTYLSPQHRDACAEGCTSAALLDEVVRRPATTRQVFTDELLGIADDIAARLDPPRAKAARTDALALFGMMIGTLQLSRALSDRDLSDQLLERGVETALQLLDNRVPPSADVQSHADASANPHRPEDHRPDPPRTSQR